jgi:hypothetical protein
MVGCQNNDFDLKNPNVEQCINIVKRGDYFKESGYELPDFSLKDIGTLLDYSKDTTAIKEFPTHPVSSKYTAPKILGECILWTVEGIRLGCKYPSLEPCIIDTTTYSETAGFLRLTQPQLIEISDMYMDWYDEYQQNPSDTVRYRYLFEDTPYIWD